MVIHWLLLALTFWLAFLVVSAMRPRRRRSLPCIPLEIARGEEPDEKDLQHMQYVGRGEKDGEQYNFWVEHVV